VSILQCHSFVHYSRYILMSISLFLLCISLLQWHCLMILWFDGVYSVGYSCCYIVGIVLFCCSFGNLIVDEYISTFYMECWYHLCVTILFWWNIHRRLRFLLLLLFFVVHWNSLVQNFDYIRWSMFIHWCYHTDTFLTPTCSAFWYITCPSGR